MSASPAALEPGVYRRQAVAETTNDNLVDELERLIRQKAAEKAEADASLIARG